MKKIKQAIVTIILTANVAQAQSNGPHKDVQEAYSLIYYFLQFEPSIDNLKNITLKLDVDSTFADILKQTDALQQEETKEESDQPNHTEKDKHKKHIATNTDNIKLNATNISNNTKGTITFNKSITDNTVSITKLSDDIDLIHSNIVASLAVAAMPMLSREGWGVALGTGYFDGESAIAAGLIYSSNAYQLKFAVGHSGGHSTASAGATWAF